MESGIVIIFASVNVGYFCMGYVLMKRFCKEEDEAWEKYRRMTELEIQLLNNKIEGLNGKLTGN